MDAKLARVEFELAKAKDPPEPNLSTAGTIHVCGAVAESQTWTVPTVDLLMEFIDDNGRMHLLFGLVSNVDADAAATDDNQSASGDDLDDDLGDFLRGLLHD